MTAPAFQTGHIGLNVTDLARSTAFYRKVLDLDLIAEQNEGDKRFAFLGYGEDLVITLWQQSSGSFDASRPGLHHLSFQAENIEQVRRAESLLKRLGVPFLYDGVVPHGEGMSSGGIFFEDPDGTRLEIYAPAGAEGRAAPAPGVPTCGFF